MNVFNNGNIVFMEDSSNPGTCYVGTNNDTLGNGAVLGTSFIGPARIPSFVFNSTGHRFRVCKTGKHTFRGCTSLKEVTLPSTLEIVGWDTFFGTSVQHLFVPSNVEILDYAAFSGMDKVETIIFERGSRLREIGDSCFYNCKSLKNILIPPLVSFIQSNMFHSSINLEFIIFCSSEDMSSIATPFDNIEHSVTVYVTSQYPSGATFGGTNVVVSDNLCEYFYESHEIESSCSTPNYFLIAFYIVLSFIIFISSI